MGINRVYFDFDFDGNTAACDVYSFFSIFGQKKKTVQIDFIHFIFVVSANAARIAIIIGMQMRWKSIESKSNQQLNLFRFSMRCSRSLLSVTS